MSENRALPHLNSRSKILTRFADNVQQTISENQTFMSGIICCDVLLRSFGRREKKVRRGGEALEAERFTLIDHFTNKHLNE
jgi:hypothetical protein